MYHFISDTFASDLHISEAIETYLQGVSSRNGQVDLGFYIQHLGHLEPDNYLGLKIAGAVLSIVDIYLVASQETVETLVKTADSSPEACTVTVQSSSSKP